MIGLSEECGFRWIGKEVFFWGGIILPLVEVTSGGIISGWLVLLFNDVFGLLVNGLEREGIFNDGNLFELEETSGVIWYFGVDVIVTGDVIGYTSGNLIFLGVGAKLGVVVIEVTVDIGGFNELELIFGNMNDGILRESLLSFEFFEICLLLGVDVRVSRLSLFFNDELEVLIALIVE